jgi:hypothetical protein
VIVYGGPIRTTEGFVEVARDGDEVVVQVAGNLRPALLRVRFPALLQLVARLKDAANEAAKESPHARVS